MKTINIFTLGLLLVSCSIKHNHEHENEQSLAKEGTVFIDANQLKAIEIITGNPTLKKGIKTLSVPGELVLHNENIATVSSNTEGILFKLYTGLNKSVKKGEALALIQKPDLIDLQREYLEAKDQLSFQKEEFERFKILKNENATSLKNFQKIESEYRILVTKLNAYAAKLKLLNINPENITSDHLISEIKILSPINGIVTKTFATLGSAVQPGTPICEVIGTDNMHPDLYVLQNDLQFVKVGQKVDIQIDSKSFSGEIISIDPMVDPGKNAIPIHIRLFNATKLTKGLFIKGEIHLNSPLEVNFAVPETAIVLDEPNHYIFILQNSDAKGNTYRKVGVQSTQSEKGWSVIRGEGIPSTGDKIVLKGGYYLFAQEQGVEEHEH
jgi:membrane fusion protein, heavy metal efflux system